MLEMRSGWRAGAAVLAGVLFISCSDRATNDPVPPTLLAGWVRDDTATITVMEDEADTMHRTALERTWESQSFQSDGSMITLLRISYEPKIPWQNDTTFRYVGTWKTVSDTLVRDMWPGALGSLDSVTYVVTNSTLTLTHWGSDAVTRYTKIIPE